MENKSVWSSFRDYINSKNIGDKVSRQELLYMAPFKASSATTDYVRNIAEKCGYLSKYKDNRGEISGIFIVEKHLESDMNCSKLRKKYDNRYCCK